MAYDDEPYWYDKKKDNKIHRKPKAEVIVSRRYPDAHEVMANIEANPRGKPSHLLLEYMQKESKENTKD